MIRGGGWHNVPRMRGQHTGSGTVQGSGAPAWASVLRDFNPVVEFMEQVLGVCWTLFSAETGWHRIEHGTLREKAMRYKIVLEESEEGFAVSVPALPGCHSQGSDRAGGSGEHSRRHSGIPGSDS